MQMKEKKQTITLKQMVYLGEGPDGNPESMEVDVEIDLSRRHPTMYFCKEIQRSSDNMFALIIHYIAARNVGKNERSLVNGILRALRIDPSDRT